MGAEAQLKWGPKWELMRGADAGGGAEKHEEEREKSPSRWMTHLPCHRRADRRWSFHAGSRSTRGLAAWTMAFVGAGTLARKWTGLTGTVRGAGLVSWRDPPPAPPRLP